MWQDDVLNLLVLEKRKYSKLCEAFDLTQQLAEAVSRRDQVSVQLLVSMRQEPIEQLTQVDENLRLKQSQLSSREGTRLAGLIAGEPPEGRNEQLLVEQMAANRRMLERVITLDRHVSVSLGGEDSLYRTTEQKDEKDTPAAL